MSGRVFIRADQKDGRWLIDEPLCVKLWRLVTNQLLQFSVNKLEQMGERRRKDVKRSADICTACRGDVVADASIIDMLHQ